MNRTQFDRYLISLAPLTLLVCSHVGAQETAASTWSHSLSTGAYYSNGDYGQDDNTTVHYVPVSYQLGVSNWQLGISVPFIKLSGSGDVLFNSGGVVGRNDPTALAGSASESGVGDVLLSATYQLPAFNENGFFFDFGVDVKIPTADDSRGLGTGSRDYGVKLDIYKLLGAFTTFSTFEYKFRGNSALFTDIQDSFNVSLGFSLPINERWSSGLIYDFRQAAIGSFGDTHELVPYVSWRQSEHWSLMSYIVKGFSDDSADQAIGLQATYTW